MPLLAFCSTLRRNLPPGLGHAALNCGLGMCQSRARAAAMPATGPIESRANGCCTQPSPGAARRPLPEGEVKSGETPSPFGRGWGEGRVPSSQLREPLGVVAKRGLQSSAPAARSRKSTKRETRIVRYTRGQEGFDFFGLDHHKVDPWRWRVHYYLNRWQRAETPRAAHLWT